MHNAAFAAEGMHATYFPVDVKPAELPIRLEAFRQLGGRGVNLTRPLKELVLPHLAGRSWWVEQTGAANTLTWLDGGWQGDNTDAQALAAMLPAAAPGRERALVVGAGGVARASAAVLAAKRYRVTVASRHPAQGLAGDWVGWGQWEAKTPWPVVINATPLGQAGESAWRDFPPVESGSVAIDWVYHPVQTAFLQYAARHGAELIDGLRLLVAQASLSWVGWFGRTGPVAIMDKAVEPWRY